MPALPDWIARFGVTKVARLVSYHQWLLLLAHLLIRTSLELTKGRNSARGADVDSFKANLSLMDRDIPPCNIDRHMLGFNNDVTGQYICAITLDFTDPLYVFTRLSSLSLSDSTPLEQNVGFSRRSLSHLIGTFPFSSGKVGSST